MGFMEYGRGQRADKRGVGRIGLNKLTEVTSDRLILVFVVNGDGGDKLLKSGGREVFFRGSGRLDDRYVSVIAVGGGEARR